MASMAPPGVRLITSSGRALTDAAAPLEPELRGGPNGDAVSAVALQMELAAAVKAVALWCCGGGWLDGYLRGHAIGSVCMVYML